MSAELLGPPSDFPHLPAVPCRYIWSSTADGSFNIVEDEENAPLGRGTLIRMHLKPEALEYAEVRDLKGEGRVEHVSVIWGCGPRHPHLHAP